MAAIHKAVDQLELLSVSNDNKVFVILLYTLIEIAEKTGTAEELNGLLETLNAIKNAPPQNKS